MIVFFCHFFNENNIRTITGSRPGMYLLLATLGQVHSGLWKDFERHPLTINMLLAMQRKRQVLIPKKPRVSRDAKGVSSPVSHVGKLCKALNSYDGQVNLQTERHYLILINPTSAPTTVITIISFEEMLGAFQPP